MVHYGLRQPARSSDPRPAIDWAGAVLQVVGLAMLLYVPLAVAELWVLLSFAVVGMGLVAVFRQFGSSVGTTVVCGARQAADAETPAKGQVWNPVAADH